MVQITQQYINVLIMFPMYTYLDSYFPVQC